MIIGTDLGNYSVKTSNYSCFFSKVTEEGNLRRNRKRIQIDGKLFYIGEGEFATDWDKSKKENTINLLYAALATEKQEVFNIVMGLPIGQFNSNKEDLKQLIMLNRFKEIIFNDKPKKIVIDDVEVAPEGASCFYAIPLNVRNEIGNKELLIIDIGGRTTDITLLVGNCVDREIEKYSTIPTGMFNIYHDIIKAINEKFTQNFRLEDAEYIIHNGLFLNGLLQDITFIQPLIKKHFNSILQEINLIGKVESGFIYLTGGGALMLDKAFKNRFKNLIVSSSPLWDNALGFKEVGEMLWQSL